MNPYPPLEDSWTRFLLAVEVNILGSMVRATYLISILCLSSLPCVSAFRKIQSSRLVCLVKLIAPNKGTGQMTSNARGAKKRRFTLFYQQNGPLSHRQEVAGDDGVERMVASSSSWISLSALHHG